MNTFTNKTIALNKTMPQIFKGLKAATSNSLMLP